MAAMNSKLHRRVSASQDQLLRGSALISRLAYVGGSLWFSSVRIYASHQCGNRSGKRP